MARVGSGLESSMFRGIPRHSFVLMREPERQVCVFSRRLLMGHMYRLLRLTRANSSIHTPTLCNFRRTVGPLRCLHGLSGYHRFSTHNPRMIPHFLVSRLYL